MITIWLLIKPWDYQEADVEVFSSQEAAKERLREGKRNEERNVENWCIQKVELWTKP